MNSAGPYWVHNLDPIAIPIGSHFGIRWYGLAYAAAFLLASWMLGWFHRKGRTPLDPAQQSLLLMAIMLGTLVGGRLGYMLLYDLPTLRHEPWAFFAVWRGGMASHGGFVGLAGAALWVAHKLKAPPFHLGDLITLVAPQGLFLGRVANFINGELWGKPSDAPWAVIFPLSAAEGTPVEWIAPRHPSQLYEAGLEGLLLLAYTQWRVWKTDAWKTPGRITGEFLILYAAVRILGEQFREPDAGLILGLSRGVFYSLFVLVAGVLILASRRPTRT